ncbi:MAG: YfcE family phosphodiesterase [Planctomycetes bacterium]|nr:YfcE family phosphodiesterase [Planctomycetota bacterium]
MNTNQLLLGILSDNHGENYQVIEDTLCDCDAILHAGDVGQFKILKSLNSLSIPLYVATGNNDRAMVRQFSKEFKMLTFDKVGLRVLMTHDPGAYNPYVLEDPPKRILEKIDEFKPHLFVFGHWHIRYAEFHKGIYCFNPGSVTKKYCRDGKPGFSKILVRKASNNDKFSFEPEYFNL